MENFHTIIRGYFVDDRDGLGVYFRNNPYVKSSAYSSEGRIEIFKGREYREYRDGLGVYFRNNP